MLLMQILIKLIINKLHLKTVMVEQSESEKKTVAVEEIEATSVPVVEPVAAAQVPEGKATAAGSEQMQVIKPVTAASATGTTEPTSP